MQPALLHATWLSILSQLAHLHLLQVWLRLAVFWHICILSSQSDIALLCCSIFLKTYCRKLSMLPLEHTAVWIWLLSMEMPCQHFMAVVWPEQCNVPASWSWSRRGTLGFYATCLNKFCRYNSNGRGSKFHIGMQWKFWAKPWVCFEPVPLI